MYIMIFLSYIAWCLTQYLMYVWKLY